MNFLKELHSLLCLFLSCAGKLYFFATIMFPKKVCKSCSSEKSKHPQFCFWFHLFSQ